MIAMGKEIQHDTLPDEVRDVSLKVSGNAKCYIPNKEETRGICIIFLYHRLIITFIPHSHT